MEKGLAAESRSSSYVAAAEGRIAEMQRYSDARDAAAVADMASAVGAWVREARIERIRYTHKLDGLQEHPAAAIRDLVQSEVSTLVAHKRANSEDTTFGSPWEPARIAAVGFVRHVFEYGRPGFFNLKWSEYDELPTAVKSKFLAQIGVAVFKCQARWNAAEPERAEMLRRMSAEFLRA